MSVTRVRNAPVVDYSWQSDAACMGANGELFLGPDEERPRDRVRRENLALLVCNACPVRSPCLEHALAVPERHGVWGVTTPEQRLTMRRGGLHLAGEGELVDAEPADGDEPAGEGGLTGVACAVEELGPESVDAELLDADLVHADLVDAQLVDAEMAVAYVPTARGSAHRRGQAAAVSELLQL